MNKEVRKIEILSMPLENMYDLGDYFRKHSNVIYIADGVKNPDISEIFTDATILNISLNEVQWARIIINLAIDTLANEDKRQLFILADKYRLGTASTIVLALKTIIYKTDPTESVYYYEERETWQKVVDSVKNQLLTNI